MTVGAASPNTWCRDLASLRGYPQQLGQGIEVLNSDFLYSPGSFF
jgi:hypothetical protein